MRTAGLALLLVLPALAGDPAAPEPRDSFRFVVFGDRTGGRPDGLSVLEHAVVATNRLDPDFTMTVGDLVQGYTDGGRWMKQMAEFKEVMKGLKRPWYPVAGNHDVYGGRKNRKEGNVALYKEHFAPLWYSFDYKWAHFVVLYSDEKLSFRTAESQNMSAEQLAWLAADLKKTTAKQVYVFLHHPRWIYRGTNWPEVHEVMAADGRVKAVFAGHVHVYRDDGVHDGIHYYVLAVTGGSATALKTPAALHHINHVNVTREGFSLSVLPIGAVVGANLAMGSEVDRLYALRARGGWLVLDGAVHCDAGGARESALTATIANPEKVPVAYELNLRVPQGWKGDPPMVGGQMQPGDTKKHTFKLKAKAFDGTRPDVSLTATLHVPLRSGLVHPVHHRRAVPVRIGGLETARRPKNSVLVLDGGSAVRLDAADVPEQFTVECWVRGEAPKGRSAVISRTEAAGFGIWWSFQGQKLPYGIVGFPQGGYKTLAANEAWTWSEWTHLALSVGGDEIRFFVDGELQAKQKRPGARRKSNRAIFIGGDPDRRDRLSYAFRGEIDEVRLSRVARYAKNFKPARHFERDEDTLMLLHFDQLVSGVFPDDSGNDRHGWPVGKPRLAEEKR